MRYEFQLFNVVEPKIKNIKLDKSKRIKVGNYPQTKKLVKKGNAIKLERNR